MIIIFIARGVMALAMAMLCCSNLDRRSPSRDDNGAGKVGCGCCPGHCLAVVTRGMGHDLAGLLASLHQAENTIESSCQRYQSYSGLNHPPFTTTDWEGIESND